MLNFEKHSEEALLGILVQLGAHDAVLNYQQIQGLLFAMSCSPEPIEPSEWFELIWLNDAPQFDDIGAAKAFYQLLVELFRSIDAEVRGNRYRVGVDAGTSGAAAALSDWCDGFLIGHHYLEQLWDSALVDIDDDDLYEQVDGVLDWAIACASGEIIDRNSADGDDILLSGHLHFQQLLAAYCGTRQRWLDNGGAWDIDRAFAAMVPAERNEPCPCGSGRLFGNCCLH